LPTQDAPAVDQAIALLLSSTDSDALLARGFQLGEPSRGQLPTKGSQKEGQTDRGDQQAEPDAQGKDEEVGA
jgi:hypothetical protein